MVKVIGHRGGRNLWAENSISGFHKAVELGVDSVELDVHLTADGQTVVIHDALLDRTTTGKGPVQAQSLEAIQKTVKLHDSLGETVPHLADVLDIYKGTGIGLELEIKTDESGRPYPGMPAKMMELVEARGMAGQVRLTCFVPEVLQECRDLFPHVGRLMSMDRRSAEFFGGVPQTIKAGLDVGAVIAVEKSVLEYALDLCVSEIGTPNLGVWVPNTVQELDYWLKQPIAQITTDRPDLAIWLRGR